MNSMFYECSSLTSLNLSNFNTNNVEDMREMFDGCSSLKKENVKIKKEIQFIFTKNVFNKKNKLFYNNFFKLFITINYLTVLI